ncbi:putative RNA pseudouridine synthase [bacterium HR29]|nr:putative RNA pseudouridine synthase [bacterium HR29]
MRVGGLPVEKSRVVEPGELVEVYVPARHRSPEPLPFDLPVLYEDDALLAIDKPAGIATHGAPGDMRPSVVWWFVQRFPRLAETFDADRPGIVHRLDKGTSGVLLLAKTPAAQLALNQAFEQRRVRKEYLALCDGVPPRERAVIDAPIGRHPGDRTRMAVTIRGRDAKTEYTVLGASQGKSLLLVRPLTGRTHQIRVHLAAIGAPVADDRVYGRRGGERPLLHAYRLVVPHPLGGVLDAASPLPDDFWAAAVDAGLAEAARPYRQSPPPRRFEEAS